MPLQHRPDARDDQFRRASHLLPSESNDLEINSQKLTMAAIIVAPLGSSGMRTVTIEFDTAPQLWPGIVDIGHSTVPSANRVLRTSAWQLCKYQEAGKATFQHRLRDLSNAFTGFQQCRRDPNTVAARRAETVETRHQFSTLNQTIAFRGVEQFLQPSRLQCRGEKQPGPDGIGDRYRPDHCPVNF